MAYEQTVVQVPQWFTSVPVFCSQPLAGLLSQLEKPVLHVGTQAPPVQAVVPFALVHALLQVPQLVVVLSATSQPFDAVLSQFPKPALHVPSWQVELLQTPEAFA